MRLPKLRRSLTALAAAALVASCGGSDATGPEPQQLIFTGPRLIACPTNETQTATGVVDPLLGGLVSVGGTSISVPAGGVLQPTVFTVTIPASQYAEVEITAEGADHFLFSLPATVTIDYSRCSRPALDLRPLVAYHIDTQSKALLENMGGVDNKVTKRVTFVTGHLSSYAIAE